MDEPITDMGQVSPEWLTRVLQKRGFLNQGKVTAVHKQPLRATISLTSGLARFAVSYSDDAPKSAPLRLFLKIAKLDFDAALSARMWKNEVDFYTTVVAAMSAPATVRCYAAVYAPETGKAHLLRKQTGNGCGLPWTPRPGKSLPSTWATAAARAPRFYGRRFPPCIRSTRCSIRITMPLTWVSFPPPNTVRSPSWSARLTMSNGSTARYGNASRY